MTLTLTYRRSSGAPQGATLVSLCLLSLAACSSRSSSSTADQDHSVTSSAASGLTSPDVYLQAQALVIPASTFSNPQPITMWAYAKCTVGYTSCDPATVPGPALTATEGTSLTIHLRNHLTGPYLEPSSLIIPGQTTAMAPVWINAATGAVTGTGARPAGDYQSRVRSFTAETPADGTTEKVYTFTNLKAGSFLYQSGTHPAVQVQMGLYGALSVYPAIAGRAYDDPSSAFDSEVTLLFSEIDPVIHQAIATGHYGNNPNAPNDPPPGWLTSTIGYHPEYFLINGQAHTVGSIPIPAGIAGARLLVRFLNAGLETKVPTLQGPYLSVMAEDGNFITVTTAAGATVPAPRQQYSTLLPAGKTVDAVVVPPNPGNLPVYDRRLSLTNGGKFPGGMLTYLKVGAGKNSSRFPTGALQAKEIP